MNELLENPVFEPMRPKRHLHLVQTSFGDREIYDSIAHCNRCGRCMQVCPSYRLTGLETHSPRGRNQIARFILEGKFKITEPSVCQSLASCTLCGRCTQHCAGKIPTAEHVLEMQRSVGKKRLPVLLQFLFELRPQHPVLFKSLVRLALFFRPAQIWKIMYFLPGFSWLKQIDQLLPAKIFSLDKMLKQEKKLPDNDSFQVIYIPSLEAEFLQPDIAVASLRLLQKQNRCSLWTNTPCGLFEYVYGDLRQSRRVLRRLIQRYNHVCTSPVPLVTDSLDVYHFLKKAPQLFAGKNRLAAQAEQFAQQVHFITEFFPAHLTPLKSNLLPVQLDYGALFSRESQPMMAVSEQIKTLLQQNFVQCVYTDFDTPSFGYSFTKGNQNESIQFELVKTIARNRAKTILVFSGLNALELNKTLRKFYPAARAVHVVHIADETL